MTEKADIKSNTIYFIAGFTMLGAIIALLVLYSINYNGMFNYVSDFYKEPPEVDAEYEASTKTFYVENCAPVTADDIDDIESGTYISIELEVVSVLLEWTSKASNGIIYYENYQLVGKDSTDALWAATIRREYISEPRPTEVYEPGQKIIVYGFLGFGSYYSPVRDRIPSIRPRYIDFID